MGIEDKATNMKEDLEGKAKEAQGKLTNDADREREGKVEQAKAQLKDVGEQVRDLGDQVKEAASTVKDKVTDSINNR